jgi:hypothetical protein
VSNFLNQKSQAYIKLNSPKKSFSKHKLIYFFIGFTEESFKVYADKVKNFADTHMQIIMADEKFEKDVLEDNNLKDHKTLNFYLPHEFGGCGEPFLKDLYGLFNIYTPDMDLA